MLRPVLVATLLLLSASVVPAESVFDWFTDPEPPSGEDRSSGDRLPSRPPSERSGDDMLPSRPEPHRKEVERPRRRAPEVPPAIGLLLPLSGEYETFGQACFRGVRLALGATGNGTPEIRTVVRDTRGQAATAVDGFRRLAEDPGVVAIVGPMLSWSVDAVTPYAERSGLATISLSQRSAEHGGPVFRFSMTKESQANTLAHHAVVEQGHQRFAILYPRDSFGTDLSLRFRERVEQLGGEVLASVGYDREKVDFQVEVEALRNELGMQPVDDSGGGSLQKELGPVLPPVDAVFIPDTAERIALLAPQLAFFDIRNVRLLGASGWNDPEALERALPYANGAVFVDGFFLYSFLPEVREFVTAYRDAFGKNPGILEAFGHDAAAMVRTLIEGGGRTRAGFRSALDRPARFRGATGWTRIHAGGRIDKEVFLLRMKGGTVQEIDRRRVFAYGDDWQSLKP